MQNAIESIKSDINIIKEEEHINQSIVEKDNTILYYYFFIFYAERYHWKY